MRSVILTLIVVAIALMAGCQSSEVMPMRAGSAASSQQDVIDAWNLHCDVYSFDPIPPNSDCIVGSMYSGADFATDSDKFMRKIQAELMSMAWGDVEDDDFVSAILDDPVWYQ